MATRHTNLAKLGSLGAKASLAAESNALKCQRELHHRRLASHHDSFSQAQLHTSPVLKGSKSDERRRAEDRQDIVVSVLQASATRRDAKNYLKKYAPAATSLTESKQRDKASVPSTWSSSVPIRAASEAPQFVQGVRPEQALSPDDLPKLAIVKLRLPQSLSDYDLGGIARTLSQLRKLGLVSVVVLDAGPAASRDMYTQQAHRLQWALDSTGPPGARIADRTFVKKHSEDPGFLPSSVTVQFPHVLARALDNEEILILPSVGVSPALDSHHLIDPDDAIMALAKHFCGLDFEAGQSTRGVSATPPTAGQWNASIERVIILDPFGAIPIAGQPGASHRFINLEQEYEPILRKLEAAKRQDDGQADEGKSVHQKNLKLLRNILFLLPSTSTALISSPSVAASRPVDSVTSVATRNKLNPLIHNLLTDKPVFSSSLPFERVRTDRSSSSWQEESPVATVVKRGMPLTIFPDPANGPWLPPQPGAPRLRLTDTCIDLPRLQYLIEDSFDRKLDLRDYLERVEDNLAGIIIAGEYEGGAILTWERPFNLSEEEAYESGRMVPYLDKFAVLKSRQGSGGVADVVFNAMVRGCFPQGVSWRSRKDNPVNKWYFERSVGTRKLQDTNWTMFWTTPGLSLTDPKLGDYEDVCRRIEPSWADKTRAAD